jgi:hypothetical protein
MRCALPQQSVHHDIRQALRARDGVCLTFSVVLVSKCPRRADSAGRGAPSAAGAKLRRAHGVEPDRDGSPAHAKCRLKEATSARGSSASLIAIATASGSVRRLVIREAAIRPRGRAG